MTKAGAISRTTLHIPFNFIRSPGEPRRKYIGARIRGSFINIVAVISLSCLVRLRPPDIQMSAGISGLTRFSASKYYLPPRRRALPSPQRRPSSIRPRRKKYKASSRPEGSRALASADLFIPARLNDSITDRIGRGSEAVVVCIQSVRVLTPRHLENGILSSGVRSVSTRRLSSVLLRYFSAPPFRHGCFNPPSLLRDVTR